MTKRHFFTLALIIICIASLQWFMVSAPGTVRPARLAEEAWKLPEQQKLNIKELLGTLNNANLWGKLAETALTPPPELEWRFLAAMVRGKDRHVIIKIDNQPERNLAPGETLPDGSKILSIDNDHLCLLVKGQKHTLDIYPQNSPIGRVSSQEIKLSAWTERAKLGKPCN